MESHAASACRVKVRCTQCHARLCDRVKGNEIWMLQYKSKGKVGIMASDCNWVIKCNRCETVHDVSAAEGITRSYRAEKYDDRTRT